MTNVLFTSAKEIKQICGIGGNIDPDKIRPFIVLAQDQDLQKLLGTQLYSEMIRRARASTITGHYQTLLNDWIKPFLAFKTTAKFIKVGGYSVANEGLTRHQPDSAIPLEFREVISLSEEYDNSADFYAGRLYEYLCVNQQSFPEFNEIQQGDIKRDSQTYFSGFQFK